jgi:hypothetical protein
MMAARTQYSGIPAANSGPTAVQLIEQGDAFAAGEETATAIERYEQALATKPGSAVESQIRLRLGKADLKMNLREKAREELEGVLAHCGAGSQPAAEAQAALEAVGALARLHQQRGYFNTITAPRKRRGIRFWRRSPAEAQ